MHADNDGPAAFTVIMSLIFQHAWLMFILVTCLNAFSIWKTAKKEIARDAELEGGYRSMVRGLVIYGNIPWIVMGAGVVFGGVPDVFHFLNPQAARSPSHGGYQSLPFSSRAGTGSFCMAERTR